ncbi:MAG: inositol monophosphatase, partial [Acidobacteria bacterium]|nr:inositol monophosphatase [Acidobacteriota bacterium]
MPRNPTNICAHRGDSSRFRENTLVAIQSAIDAGAEVIEIDVRISKDGKVVVIHDPTLERLWGLDRYVSDVTWQEISALGSGNFKIPLLEEVLPLFENSNSILMIDMEESDPAKLAFEVSVKSSATIYWCGDLEGMRIIRSLSESANIWMPWNVNATVTASDIAELKPTFINSHYS